MDDPPGTVTGKEGTLQKYVRKELNEHIF